MIDKEVISMKCKKCGTEVKSYGDAQKKYYQEHKEWVNKKRSIARKLKKER